MTMVPDSAPVPPLQPAPDSTWDIQAPYATSAIKPVFVGGDPDAGGRDDVAATVAEAMANAVARYSAHQAETYGPGDPIGDVMSLPPSPLDPGVGSTGTTDPAGGYYDPPRNYA
jgi:hypothetical protein